MRWVFLVLLGSCQWVFPLADADVDADAMIDPPDSGPSTPSCSTKLGALVDPLATPTKAWSPEISAPHSLTYDTSGAHITVINSGIVSLRTRAFYDLRDSHFTIDVDAVLDTSAEVGVALHATERDPYAPLRRVIKLSRVTNNQGVERLVAKHTEEASGAEFVINDSPFEPLNHRFWKITREAGAVRWYTSGDGQRFTMFADTDLDITFVKPQLFVVSNIGDATNTATFRAVNGGDPTMADPICPADQLIDTFDRPELDYLVWGQSAPTAPFMCRFEPTTGSATVEVTTADNNACELSTSGLFDLVAAPLTVEVGAVSVGAQRLALELVNFDDVSARFEVSGPTLSAFRRQSSVSVLVAPSVPYDGAQHRFWRFVGTRSNEGLEQIEWQTSPDGQTFAFLGRVATIQGLDRVRLRFLAFNDGLSGIGSRFEVFGVNPP